MAEAAKRSSANTTLYVAGMKAEVGLFGTKADPGKTQKFDTAGPQGGVLRYEQRAFAAPVEEARELAQSVAVKSDPLAESPAVVEPPGTVSGTEVFEETPAPAPVQPVDAIDASGGVDGEYRQVLVEEGTDAIVEPEDVRRGVRLGDGRFVDLTEQLDAIEARTKLDRIDVVRCIDSTQVRRERVVGAYYIGGQDEQALPVLRLLYEALRDRREVAIVKYTTRSRQQLGVIAPHAKTGTLVLLSLVFHEDFREAPAKAKAIARAEVTSGQVEAMGAILAALHGHVDDLDEQRDDAIALREELKARAEAGEMDVAVVEPPARVEEPSLEAALEASLAVARAGKV